MDEKAACAVTALRRQTRANAALTVLLLVVVVHSAVSAVWSLRDIQGFEHEHGIGFYPGYEPKLWLSFAWYVACVVAALIVACRIRPLQSAMTVLIAAGAAALFYRDHFDPFYRDWAEDCMVAQLEYDVVAVVAISLSVMVPAIFRSVTTRSSNPSPAA